MVLAVTPYTLLCGTQFTRGLEVSFLAVPRQNGRRPCLKPPALRDSSPSPYASRAFPALCMYPTDGARSPGWRRTVHGLSHLTLTIIISCFHFVDKESKFSRSLATFPSSRSYRVGKLGCEHRSVCRARALTPDCLVSAPGARGSHGEGASPSLGSL